MEKPHLLLQFGLITFADLKKFKFFYWFSFPALLPEKGFLGLAAQGLGPEFSHLHQFHDTFKNEFPDQQLFFLVKRNKEASTIELGRLVDWKDFHPQGEIPLIGFVDPSCQPANPGWPLRNFLLLIQQTWNVPRVQVVALRDAIEDCITFTVDFDSNPVLDSMPKFVGWERGANGTPTPRVANLGPMMDPKKLADSAVDLNLKLMRWRILPSLNLEKISSTKCLLLGAGTLGCYVGRLLMVSLLILYIGMGCSAHYLCR